MKPIGNPKPNSINKNTPDGVAIVLAFIGLTVAVYVIIKAIF
jgi:hypothetical protein